MPAFRSNPVMNSPADTPAQHRIQARHRWRHSQRREGIEALAETLLSEALGTLAPGYAGTLKVIPSDISGDLYFTDALSESSENTIGDILGSPCPPLAAKTLELGQPSSASDRARRRDTRENRMKCAHSNSNKPNVTTMNQVTVALNSFQEFSTILKSFTIDCKSRHNSVPLQSTVPQSRVVKDFSIVLNS